MTDVQEKTNLTREQSDEALQRFTDGFISGLRAPVLHRPSEVGLEYEDVTFPARDGVPLEGWFIPAPGSAKLIVANHPFSFSRSGIPTHIEPWHAIWAPSGNGFEVNLVPDYKILHDAGYQVLTYDLRNHGLSGAANGGVISNGVTESRDVAGSLDYARERFGARQMAVGLFSRCTGGNATFCAMARWPAAFDGVRCLVSPQPITTAIIIQHRIDVFGIADRFDDFTSIVRLRNSIGLEQRVPQQWAKSVRVPTFLYGVHDDVLTDPSDLQAMYDNIPSTEKKLQLVENTTARWDGYMEFQRRPQPMLDWFARYL